MRKSAIFVTALLIASALIGATRSDKADVSRSLDVFNSVFKVLQTTYVDTIDANKSINVAIEAMLDDLDPYTEYIPESEQESFLTIATGEYGGIGSYIMERNGNVYVSEPQAESPALVAGLKAGDMFIAIDGDTVMGMPSDKVSAKLRGQAGTVVNVKVKRPYATDSILDFAITRRKIKVHPVAYYGMLRDSIGYIAITTFNEKTVDEAADAFLHLKQANPDMRGLILDLRDNGGGILEGAVKLAGLFVPKNTEVVRTRGRDIVNEKIYRTPNKPLDTEIPLAILINGSSASSSEIMAGSMQDLDRAVIVGSTSYGKGLVQSSRPLPYNGLLKVTIAKYYIPSGRLIQAIDYSHRNPDGTVARIPDSLTNEFKTAAGRIVRDGGGITPDVKVEYGEVNMLTYNLVRGYTTFDFATKFAAEHDSIGPVEDFRISDEVYNEFKQFADPNKFNYNRVCETILDQLEKAAKAEGYLNDSTSAQIAVLRDMLRHDLNRDLDTHRSNIEEYLEAEIAQRYYNQRGRLITSLRRDIAVDSAINVLRDPARYRSILSPEAKK